MIVNTYTYSNIYQKVSGSVLFSIIITPYCKIRGVVYGFFVTTTRSMTPYAIIIFSTFSISLEYHVAHL